MEKEKANLMLGITNRGVSYKSAEAISKLHKLYVRPNLRVLYPVLDTNKCERCRYSRGGYREEQLKWFKV